MKSAPLFFTLLGNELLKLRRTLALRLTLAAPGLLVVLAILQFLHGYRHPATRPDLWLVNDRGMIMFWSLMVLPLLVGLMAALLHAPEHEQKHWKQLRAQPVPPAFLYLSKLLVAVLLLALATALLWAGAIAYEAAFTALHLRGVTVWPSLRAPFWPALPLAFAGALLILALHHWLSSSREGFVLPLGVVMAGVVATLMSHASTIVGKWLPWALPVSSAVRPDIRPWALTVSIAGFLLVTILGCVEFSQREIPG